MNADEKLSKFKAYFLCNVDKMPPGVAAGLISRLGAIDVENFECVFDTLTPDEQRILFVETDDDYALLAKDLVYNKTLHRYFDAVDGRTDYDNEAGQLVLSPESSALELGISYNLFLKLRSIGLYSIKQLYQSLKIVNLYTTEEVEGIKLAVQWLQEDASARLEGMSEVQDI